MSKFSLKRVKFPKKKNLKGKPIFTCLLISLQVMYFGLGIGSTFQGADPTNEAGPSTTIDEILAQS